MFSQGKAQGSGREWECTNSFPPQLPSHAQPVSEGKFDGATSAFGISRVPFFVKPPPSLHLAYLPKGERQGGGRGGASPRKGISGHPKSGRRVVKLSLRNKSSRMYTAQPLRHTPKRSRTRHNFGEIHQNICSTLALPRVHSHSLVFS